MVAPRRYGDSWISKHLFVACWCGSFRSNQSKCRKAPQPKLGNEIKPVLLAPGDVVIAHRFLAHSATNNYSPNIRYQVYFRLSPQDWQKFNQHKLDPWAEFRE